MKYETIEYETPEKGIGILSLNRPRIYNAVNHQMMEELEDFWQERDYDLETAVIVFKGNGTKGFCAGIDMRETINMNLNAVGLEQALAMEDRNQTLLAIGPFLKI